MEKEHKKILIVFDLDETLLFTRLKKENSYYKEQEDFCIGLENAIYKVFIRPGAKELIQYCQQHCEVGIWSSAKSDYVEALAEKLFDKEKLLFVWHHEHCDQEESEHFENTVVKNFSKLPYPIEKILAIDDDISVARHNPKNLIHVSIFRDNPNSYELFDVLNQIELRSFSQDVRS